MAEEAGSGGRERKRMQEGVEGGGAERVMNLKSLGEEQGVFLSRFEALHLKMDANFEALHQKMDAKFEDVAAKIDDVSFQVREGARERECV